MGIGPFELVIILIIWVLPCVLIAKWAERKGHSFGIFLVLGLLISPFVSLIVAAVVSDKRQPQQVTMAPGPSDHLDRLQQITELRDKGTLSEAEYQDERERIMGSR